MSLYSTGSRQQVTKSLFRGLLWNAVKQKWQVPGLQICGEIGMSGVLSQGPVRSRMIVGSHSNGLC